MKNYTIYHLHTMLSNGVTNIDSVTKFGEYVKKAKECNMTSLAFSEHGSVFEWKHKKDAVEKVGMKYIHAIETYITEKPFWDDVDADGEPIKVKIRDNYHCVLIAKNYEGFKEINRLSSKAFNRDDGHFYYAPRIFFEELLNTSDNIIVCSACIASPLSKGNEEIKKRYIEFLKENSHRCFLEIQHHNTDSQKTYNRYLYNLSRKIGVRLIAGTDTHCLNEEHAEARVILQRGKNTFFEDEEGWDLTFKTYDELIDAYKVQNALPEDVFLEAIENTNVMSDMVESFSLDTSFKYPKVSKNPEEELKNIVYNENKINEIVAEGYDKQVVLDRIDEEYNTAKAIDSCEYFLLQKHITDWCHENDIWTGPGRGSAASSLLLYMFGTTEINPLKHGFQFWRFMHKDKYSLADVDVDYSNEDRDKVLEFMLKNHLNLNNIHTSHIITFNTIALKGAIKDIGRGLGMSIAETTEISNAVHDVSEDENKITVIDDEWREKYPELFKYVDIVMGTITSIGSHPSGVLVTDRSIEEEVGTCYLKDNEYPVSCLNMKELDSLNFTKFDVLGLDNVGIINRTCKLAGIDRISARNVDIEDDNVWKSIQENTDLIFQVSGNFGSRTIGKIFSKESTDRIFGNIDNFTRMDLFSFTNALLRPCGKSVYEDATNGISRMTGIKDIDNELGSELGYPLFQETQMEFVMKFCGYSFLDADHLRKVIGKKLGTREELPKIKEGFYEHGKKDLNLTEEQAENIINPFLQCILDATRYSFCRIHAYSYSYIGYICAYLKYYYPMEYLTACLNVWRSKEEKTNECIEYAKIKNIKILEPRFRHGTADYSFDKDSNTIYKGMLSIKYLNEACSNYLYSLRNETYPSFVDLLYTLSDSKSINSRQLEVLVKLDFFEEFGNSKELLRIINMFSYFKEGKAKSLSKSKISEDSIVYSIISRNSKETEKTFTQLNTPKILSECEELIRSWRMPDFSIKDKALTQRELLGYINIVTNKKEDRPKVLVFEKRILKSKKTNKPWAVMIEAQSIGSGKKSKYTILYKNYEKEPFSEFDTLFIKKWSKKGEYFYIDQYEKIFETS